MWVVFRKSDGAVVGSTGASKDDKEKAVRHVAGNLIGKPDAADFDAIEVTDEDQLFRLAENASRGRARVQTRSGTLSLVEETREDSRLTVTTNATELHPVDQVPLIPGDGESFLVVTLQKRSREQGAPMTRVTKDNDVIWLRASHGTLREDRDQNPQEIRSVKLAGGTAKFRLYSERAKRLATVDMLSANPELEAGGLRVEFI